MNIKEKLEEQYERFISEVDAIKSQEDFIEESVVLANIKVNSNNFIRALIPHFKSIDEVNHKLDELIKKLIQSRSELEKQISESKYQDIPECFTSIDSRSNEGEVLQFIFDIIEDGETNYQKIADEFRTQIETMCIINAENIDGETFLELYDNPQKIKKYIDVCNKIKNNSKINDLKESIKLIEHHIKLLNLINIKNPINIYRQAFIQLIAVFDTITFEFFQHKFNSNFFDSSQWYS